MNVVLKYLPAWLILLALTSPSLAAQQSSDEWIRVYFNMPADHSVAYPQNESNSNWNLLATLEELIDSATTSIDLCIYDLEHPDIAHALARAKNRGVRVRVVTDNHNRTDGGKLDEEIWRILAEAEIISIDDDGDIYMPDGSIIDNDLVNDGADMHNKFAVIDYLSPSPDDDYVWTGSTNLTYTGNFNTNHTIVIKDTDVAAVYTQEFEQMWGGSGDFPDINMARFHKDKADVDMHVFDVGGTRVEVYFAPINRDRTKPSVSERIVKLLETEAQHDINFQAFAITPNIPISQTMWNLTESGDIKLRGAIDRGFYSRYRSVGDIWASEAARSDNREILPANELRKLHHKLIIIDAEHPAEDDTAIVVAGSYNFSLNAENNNDENTLIIYSDEIANQFYQDFMGVMSRAREATEPPAPEIIAGQWYDVFSISDGSRFEIEVVPGFGYSTRLLGVNVPSIYAGADSAYYFSGVATEYVRKLLEGRKVRLYGFDGGIPEARSNAFQAYVEVDFDGEPLSLNKTLLEKGYGTYSVFYRQNHDSTAAFNQYEQTARAGKKGLWKDEDKIGTKVLRSQEVGGEEAVQVIFPININTADAATLQLLPGIGPAFSQRIIEFRTEKGGFNSVEELIQIRGIGEKTMQQLRPIVTID